MRLGVASAVLLAALMVSPLARAQEPGPFQGVPTFGPYGAGGICVTIRPPALPDAQTSGSCGAYSAARVEITPDGIDIWTRCFAQKFCLHVMVRTGSEGGAAATLIRP